MSRFSNYGLLIPGAGVRAVLLTTASPAGIPDAMAGDAWAPASGMNAARISVIALLLQDGRLVAADSDLGSTLLARPAGDFQAMLT